jgi:type IV pilus assembly protein PilF
MTGPHRPQAFACTDGCVVASGLRWACAGLIVTMVVSVFGGCASTGPADPGGRDIVTASDETDIDRRARARFQLAVAYYSQGQLETALDEVKQAIAVKPDFAAAFNLRGLIYSNMGRDQLADESFSHALQLDPRDADTMHNYGWFHCQAGRYDVAEQLFERALKVPGYRTPARTLLAQGVCQVKANRFADGERTLMRAFELDPSNSATSAHLAELFYRRGEFERARFYVRRALSNSPPGDASTLWLAARIERKLGNRRGADQYGSTLRQRYPQSREAIAYEQGRFDE